MDYTDILYEERDHVARITINRPDVRNAMSQAIADAEPGQVPVVAWRENHSDWVAILKMDDLMNFVREFVTSTQNEEPAPERTDSTQNTGDTKPREETET